MVQLLGEFPESFTDTLGSDHQDVLVVRYPEKVDEHTVPEGVRMVIAVSHGTDNVDAEFLQEKGIEFHRVPVAARDVTEFCVSAAIALLRRLPVSSVEDWTRPEGHRLEGRTWGVVGLGVVGQEVVKLADALGCKVLAYDPYVKDDAIVGSLDALAGVDIVSVHVPLTQETQKLVGKEFLAKFEGVLIDVSRGGVVDTEAVLAALSDGTLFGAALDVFPEEPYPGSIIEEGLNLIATPHVAANTAERWGDAAREVMHLISG
jgi:D-3-phosphoglycerate dehydrogenase